MMNKLKDTFQIEKEFISNVSHELQTPISIIQNRLENIINEESVSDELMIKLSDSQRTLNRMSRIIKALLLISKIENDQYLKQDSIGAIELMDEVLEEIEERLSEKKITLHKYFYDDFTMNHCNRTLLFTMMTNLVNNAIKYNKDGGTIDIYTRYKEGRFQIEIKDSGIGIEKHEVDGIFDRFTRLNKSKADGYGLGLPLVKTIAGFHKIEIIVDSMPDIGTEFILRF
jgi:signal transduction histidine kinase